MINRVLVIMAFLGQLQTNCLGQVKQQNQAKQQTKGQAEIYALMTSREVLWSEGKMDQYIKLYWKDDSLRLVDDKLVASGWAKVRDYFKTTYPNKKAMGTFKCKITDYTKISENEVHLIGSWERKASALTTGYFSMTWKKKKNEWYIVIEHIFY